MKHIDIQGEVLDHLTPENRDEIYKVIGRCFIEKVYIQINPDIYDKLTRRQQKVLGNTCWQASCRNAWRWLDRVGAPSKEGPYLVICKDVTSHNADYHRDDYYMCIRFYDNGAFDSIDEVVCYMEPQLNNMSYPYEIRDKNVEF